MEQPKTTLAPAQMATVQDMAPAPISAPEAARTSPDGKKIYDKQAAREADEQKDRSAPGARKIKVREQFGHALIIHNAAPSQTTTYNNI